MTLNQHDPSRIDVNTIKPKYSRDRATGWLRAHDKLDYKKRLEHTAYRFVNARYTNGRGPVTVWIQDTVRTLLFAPPGFNPPTKYRWAVLSGQDERKWPREEDWMDIPPDRNNPALAAWYVEKHFAKKERDGSMTVLEHFIDARHFVHPWARGAHPDDREYTPL